MSGMLKNGRDQYFLDPKKEMKLKECHNVKRVACGDGPAVSHWQNLQLCGAW